MISNVSNCEKENKCEYMNDSETKQDNTKSSSLHQSEENESNQAKRSPKEDLDNLEVVAPEGTSFEFLTQPASMEESYVEINPHKIEASQIKISGEIDNEETTADATKNKTYASVVSENNVQVLDKPEDVSVIVLDETCKDKSVILCDSPIDDSVVILEKTQCDDSVIICDEEIDFVRNLAQGSSRSPSPNRENDNRRITRGSLKKETGDREEIVLLKTDDVAEKDLKILQKSDFTESDESESGDSVESVETQITTDLEKSDAETVNKDVEDNSENTTMEASTDKLNESLKIDLRPSWQAKK